MEFCCRLLERAVIEGITHYFHLPRQKSQIVNRGEPHPENFVGSEEMVQVGRSELGTGGAIA